MSDSPELMDCAFRLANSVLNLPNGQVMFFEKFMNCEINSACQKAFGAIVEMMSAWASKH